MPYADGTGPRGEGPMTGRRMGRCSGNYTERARGFGRSFGRGQGRGRPGEGWGRGWGGESNSFAQENNTSALDAILDTLENILHRLDKSEK